MKMSTVISLFYFRPSKRELPRRVLNDLCFPQNANHVANACRKTRIPQPFHLKNRFERLNCVSFICCQDDAEVIVVETRDFVLLAFSIAKPHLVFSETTLSPMFAGSRLGWAGGSRLTREFRPEIEIEIAQETTI